MNLAFGKLEGQLLAYSQLRGTSTVASEEIIDVLGFTPVQTREVLSRLTRRGIIARVRRGLYLVPPTLPLGGKWTPSDFLAVETLISDREGTYQICGPSAFFFHGLIDQVPNRLYAYNNVSSGQKRIGTTHLSLIKVNKSRLGEVVTFRCPEGICVNYSSLTRTLIDAIYDWSRFGSLPIAFEWIRGSLKRNLTTPSSLVDCASRFANLSTLRRLGKLLEIEKVEEKVLRRIERQLPRTTAEIPWVPNKRKVGTIDRRWGVVFNE